MLNLGLRPRIAILLLLPLALLAALAQALLQWDMQRHVETLERAEATGDLRRVLASIDGQAQNLTGVLRSWSNWSDMYEHALQPSSAFRDEELSPDALAVAGIDWLALIGPQGQLSELVEVPQSDGAMPASAVLRLQAQAYQSYFVAMAGRTGCGITRASRRLALVCYSPVRRSDGSGDHKGLVMTGRWIDGAMLMQVAQQTGRNVRLEALVDTPPGAGDRPGGGAMFGETVDLVRSDGPQLTLSTPVFSLLGEPVGELQMDWPRRDMVEAGDRLVSTQRAMALLVVVSGLLLVFLLDQLVVKRLSRLREELGRTMAQGNWHGRVTQQGSDEIGQLAGFFNQLLDLVRRQMGELRDLSTTDALTGLANRRAFDERLNYLLVRHARQERAAALVVFDVDHFKRYNDALGHPAGDEALKALARCLKETVRRQLDLPARIGGEEFGVLLEDADAVGAMACAEGIRLAIAALAITHPDHPDPPDAAGPALVSVSLGVTVFRAGDTAEALYRRADAALYASKQAGRNRVTLAE